MDIYKDKTEELCRKQTRKLDEEYKGIRRKVEHDPRTIRQTENAMLSDFYFDMLRDTEMEIKETMKENGIVMVTGTWGEIGLKLKKPSFILCDIGAAEFMGPEDGMGKDSGIGKSAGSGYLLPSASALAGGLFIAIPKASNLVGCALILLGGALFAKQKIDEKNMFTEKRQNSAPAVSIDEVLKEQYRANGRLVEKWFDDLYRYIMEAVKSGT